MGSRLNVVTGNYIDYEEVINLPTKLQLKAAELSTLLKKYKDDMAGLQDTWVSVSFVDGSTEGDKKAVIQVDAAEVKAKYLADKAAINQKYL